MNQRLVAIPTLVRIKPGALDRVGIYLSRYCHRHIAVMYSAGLPQTLSDRLAAGLQQHGVEVGSFIAVDRISLEIAQEISETVDSGIDAIVGLGGGKALDIAKYTGYLLQKPYYAVPTSLSNDGFCSPQSSLVVGGKRASLPSGMPFGIAVDTEVCLQSPKLLWWSGVGDLVAKFTAVQDWKLAFHKRGEHVDDFAALLSDASVFQFIARPSRDIEGTALLATALMLNGISMGVCGSSRPASGSEHLISHALDSLSERPRLHGLQVGVAAYLVSHLHNSGSLVIRRLFDETGFWEAVRQDPMRRDEWQRAIKNAPRIKADRYTVLSSRDCTAELMAIIDGDDRLQGCFV